MFQHYTLVTSKVEVAVLLLFYMLYFSYTSISSLLFATFQLHSLQSAELYYYIVLNTMRPWSFNYIMIKSIYQILPIHIICCTQYVIERDNPLCHASSSGGLRTNHDGCIKTD